MEIREFEVTIKGITPLLFNRFLENSISSEVKKRSGSVEKTNVEDKLYKTKEDKIYTPSTHISGMLVDSAKNFKIRGKGKSTYSKLAGSCIEVEPDVIIHKNQKWEEFSVSAVIPSTRGRIMVTRPMMKNWEINFNLKATDDIPEDVLKNILDYGGQYVGIGDWRPDKKGKYGKFIVTKFKLVT
jgi:hypothetical protein